MRNFFSRIVMGCCFTFDAFTLCSVLLNFLLSHSVSSPTVNCPLGAGRWPCAGAAGGLGGRLLAHVFADADDAGQHVPVLAGRVLPRDVRELHCHALQSAVAVSEQGVEGVSTPNRCQAVELAAASGRVPGTAVLPEPIMCDVLVLFVGNVVILLCRAGSGLF